MEIFLHFNMNHSDFDTPTSDFLETLIVFRKKAGSEHTSLVKGWAWLHDHGVHNLAIHDQ